MSREHPHESIVIVDLGSQTAMLIARRVRELNVYCELLPATATRADIERLRARGVILSGGPSSVHDEGAPRAPDWSLDGSLPTLGICYGMQTMAQQLGGQVAPGREREFGSASVTARADGSALLRGLPEPLPVWMSHGDRVEVLPAGFEALASTATIPIAAMTNGAGLYGIQFHPEVMHTPDGPELLRNFVHDICGCSGDWTAEHFVTETIEEIRARVGDRRVICGLSGGVDSAVAATLVHRAIGDQLTCVFVDNGLLRRGEREQVEETFSRQLHINLRTVDAGDRFLEELAGVTDPETKRKRVGETFIAVFEESARELGAGSAAVDLLVQGTTYPDVVESAGTGAGGATATIKSHHNVGGLPDDLRFELVEPLRYLFKDEVRAVGRELGLPDEIVERQPFPGSRAVDPDHRRGDARKGASAAGRRRRGRGGSARGRPGTRALAVVRNPDRHPHRRRAGRRADLRLGGRAPRSHRRRRNDRRLGALARRSARPDRESDRERDSRAEPRGLRHHLEAARHD